MILTSAAPTIGGAARSTSDAVATTAVTAPDAPHAALRTQRLSLVPADPAHAGRIFEILSDWDVGRMLRTMAFPPDRTEIDAWLADQPRQRASGEAYRYAILVDERVVGMVYLDAIADGEANLGYWLGRDAWGLGYAGEAARAAITLGFDRLGLHRLRAGHAEDNAASGRLLSKLGFVPLDIVERPSRPRGGTVRQHRYVLTKT